eukprot:m51a1_g10631 hypothetical protein (853) ;mRNA; f:58670-61810
MKLHINFASAPAGDILAHIHLMETEYGGKLHPLALRPRHERTSKVCRDHPLVPEAELELMPHLVSREDALGYSFAVFNDRLQRGFTADRTCQDMLLGVYGTPGIGKTRFLEEIAKVDPARIPEYLEHARTHLADDVLATLAPGSFAGDDVAELQAMVSRWVAVPVTYSTTPADSLVDDIPERGLALRMLHAHFYQASDFPSLQYVSWTFPYVVSVVEAATAIIRDHWELEAAESEDLPLALLLIVDEVVQADGPPDSHAVRTGQHSRALGIVHTVGLLQEYFWGQVAGGTQRRRATVFSAISTLNKAVVGLTSPVYKRAALYAPMCGLRQPTAAASDAVQRNVAGREEYRKLFYDCGRWPRGAMYCAESTMNSGEGAWSISELEQKLWRHVRRSFNKEFASDDTRLCVALSHALCSHALERSKPVPGLPLPRTANELPTTLADLVATAVYDGIELAPKGQQSDAPLDTYVPFLTPIHLLQYAGYDPTKEVPTRKAVKAAEVTQFVKEQREHETSVKYLKDEILIGIRGGKAEERFQDGHEFERLLVMRLGLCPSLRLELGLPAIEGMAADELLLTLFGGGDALCNDRTRQWLSGTMLLCQHRRVVVSFAGVHVSTFLGQLDAELRKLHLRAMAEALDDVVLYPQPETNNPGFQMIVFAQARCADGKLIRVAIAVEARCSKAEARYDDPAAFAAAAVAGPLKEGKPALPELDQNVDVLDKRNNALIQAGLAPMRQKRKADSPPQAAHAPGKKARGGKELEADPEGGPEAEGEADGEAASPAPETAVFKTGWAIHPKNGFDRFLFVVMTSRASSRIVATSLPDDTVVVAHTALRKLLGSTLYLHSRLDTVQDVL